MDARFAVYRLLPESEALDYANDVLALSQEGRKHLERAYQAHVMSDWAGYLHETENIQRSLLDSGLPRPDRPAGARVRSMIYPTAAELLAPGNRRRAAAGRLLTRFTVQPNGCWRWDRAVTTSGYGHFSIESIYYQAHRLLYILLVGPIPDGLEPDHLCRNRWCVNPTHMELVTRSVNIQRGSRTRLSPAQVAEIRRARSQGRGVRSLARQYGVNHATVSRIVNGLIWRDERPIHESQAA